MQLFSRAGWFRQKAEWRHLGCAVGDLVAQPIRKRIEIGPVAELALEENKLRQRKQAADRAGGRAHERRRPRQVFLLIGNLAELMGKACIVGGNALAFAAGCGCFIEPTLRVEGLGEQEQGLGMRGLLGSCARCVRIRVRDQCQFGSGQIQPGTEKARRGAGCGQIGIPRRAGRVADGASRLSPMPRGQRDAPAR
ncbi:MAG: hypothetical protein IPH43_14960 [Xanthomonadales bacterium]|nr:hypothetical protein [Xanthomonadales bacterium]